MRLFFTLILPVWKVLLDMCFHFPFFQTLKSGDNNKDLLGWKVSFICSLFSRSLHVHFGNDPPV